MNPYAYARRRTWRRSLAGATVAVALIAAAPASADTISYVRDGNVYLTTPNGARTAQVTTAGGYSSASQADDGRIVALKGDRFHLLNRWGDVLADFSPVGNGTAGTITLHGPFDPAVSPDGSRVAYGFYVQYRSGDPNCGRPGGCWVGQLYAGTGYSRSDGSVEWGQAGFRPEWGWTDPSWIDDRQTLIAGPSSAYLRHTAIDDAGDAGNAMEWFSDYNSGSSVLYDAEMNRQRSAVAAVANTAGDHLRVYRLAEPPADGVFPEGCLDAPAQGGPWTSPSWAPNGERLVAAGPQGLYIAELPGIGASCPDAASVEVTLLNLPGAKSPDWGPAELPGPKPVGPNPPGPGPGPKPGPGPGPNPGPGPGPSPGRFTVSPAGVRLAPALRKGMLVTVHCGNGRVKVAVKRGGTTVARGSGRCRVRGARVRVRFTPSAKRALRRARFVRLTVAATAGERSGTARVTLRR